MSWTTGNSRKCGLYPYADHFYVTRTGDNTWSDPQPYFLTTTRMESIGGIHIIENATRRIAYCMSGFSDGEDSLYFAYDDGKDGWESLSVDVGFTFDAYLFDHVFFSDNQDHEHADPWVNEAGTVMFFWSDRDDSNPDDDEVEKDIYYSTNPNSIDSGAWSSPAWTTPVKLPSPINTEGDDMQTFVFTEADGDYLYYSTNRGSAEHGYEIAIYRSKMPAGWESTPSLMETEVNWGTPERVIYSDLAVGEPSITADGQYMYFEQIFHDGANNFNPEIMRVERN